MEPININQTTFFKGLHSTYGKIPITLELCLGFNEKKDSINLCLYVGMDKMYKVSDIGDFIETLDEQKNLNFGKKFILEPTKMYFDLASKKILEFIRELKIRRLQKNDIKDVQFTKLKSNEICLLEDETERFLDKIWTTKDSIVFSKDSSPIIFENDTNIIASIEETNNTKIISFDYSEHGFFQPLTVNFRYIIFIKNNTIVKVPECKQEVVSNIYNFRNTQNKVFFEIDEKQITLFKKNFYDVYKNELNISVSKNVESSFKKSNLISKVYIDISTNGIVSKVEFSYDDQIINPLNKDDFCLIQRDFEMENKILYQLQNYGFKEIKLLFYLDDVEKIMFLLTDQMKELKKIAQVYYSQDFKQLHVKNLSNISFDLARETSVIHMNINLENIDDDELLGLLESLKKRKKYFRLKNGSIINLTSVDSDSLADLLNKLDIHNVTDGVIEIPLNRCLYIDNYLKEKNIENVSIDEGLGRLINNILTTDDFKLNLKPSIESILRSYQLTGVEWLKTMASYSMGGILADDMGLGKTLQILAFLSTDKSNSTPSIVVAPKSIIYNWVLEAKKFTPDIKVCLISGDKKYRENSILNCSKFDLLVTSYGSLKNDIDHYKNIEFSYVFIDEAQNIKNPLTLNANSVKSLNAKCCFAITGTPIENRLSELWSIFDFIMPGYLYDLIKFKTLFEIPIIKHSDIDKIYELTRLTKPFILRRLKKDVLKELPDKIITNYVSEMTCEQKKVYAAYYKAFKKELTSSIDMENYSSFNIQILTLLTRLRQICAHPSSFINDYSGGSCKLDLSLELINKAISSGQSVLLFSQFTKILHIVKDNLEKEGISYHYLDGTMTAEQRVCSIDNFNSDSASVFLISLKAGGTGLNLTKANVVIHFDPWWNPAVESQASDRAHRIGQENIVQVYKLIAEGTIEEKIIELQNVKQDLQDNIVHTGENFLTQLTESELRNLFVL